MSVRKKNGAIWSGVKGGFIKNIPVRIRQRPVPKIAPPIVYKTVDQDALRASLNSIKAIATAYSLLCPSEVRNSARVSISSL